MFMWSLGLWGPCFRERLQTPMGSLPLSGGESQEVPPLPQVCGREKGMVRCGRRSCHGHDHGPCEAKGRSKEREAGFGCKGVIPAFFPSGCWTKLFVTVARARLFREDPCVVSSPPTAYEEPSGASCDMGSMSHLRGCRQAISLREKPCKKKVGATPRPSNAESHAIA